MSSKPSPQQDSQSTRQQHQRHHSQYFPPKQYQQQILQRKLHQPEPPPSIPAVVQQQQHQSINSFPRSVTGVFTASKRAIVTHSEIAVPRRVTLYGSDTQGVEKGLGTLVPPPQFRLVPVNPPAAASWHLKITERDSKQQQQYQYSASDHPTSKGAEPTTWQQEKPKSWDNLLSTKSFGGYGFGYGFIDINNGANRRSSKTSRKDTRSVSTNRLNDDLEETSETVGCMKPTEAWAEMDRSRTVPRRIKTTTAVTTAATSADTLVSPVDMSCFPCECIGIDHSPLEACMFSKPKSTESLISGPNIQSAASETSLAEHSANTSQQSSLYRRRSRTSSLADCLGGGNKHSSQKDQMTHL